MFSASEMTLNEHVAKQSIYLPFTVPLTTVLITVILGIAITII